MRQEVYLLKHMEEKMLAVFAWLPARLEHICDIFQDYLSSRLR